MRAKLASGPGWWEVDTPSGVARVHLRSVPHGLPRATLVLGHGVGGGIDAPDLVVIADALPPIGVEVVLVEQPWRVRGQRLGGPPATLDAAWVACLRDLRGRGVGVRRLVVGGRSSGARVACRTLAETVPDALLLLAFPVWPASRAAMRAPQSRLPELLGAAATVPTVVIQGTRDPLGSPDEIAVGLADNAITARVVPVPGADHSFAVPVRGSIPREAALELVARAARATALRIIDGHY